MKLLSWLLVAGCASSHGVHPAAPVPAPVFSVVNQDGQPRTQQDLLGKPTVLWFYPAAATYG